MNEKFTVVLTCLDYCCTLPRTDRLNELYDSFDEAIKAIETSVMDELSKLNKMREKVAIEDSDGDIVRYDYPFRAEADENYYRIIRFWDGDDYQNVLGYNIYKV